MKTLIYSNLTPTQRQKALQRPIIKNIGLENIVNDIIKEVKTKGDKALINQTLKFDKCKISNIRLSEDEINKGANSLDANLKDAIKAAYDNIYKFHQAQIPSPIKIETSKGVYCELLHKAIAKVGLYIPGGLAPLFSTVLMLAIPAKIAKCSKIVLASPAKINNAILFSARLCEIDEIYQMGGAGAIAALAYGSESVIKVDKIYGPGNAFVTEAKRQVSNDINGANIDMQAGPSEVLVIADESADADFIASDLLSQAEHGTDSQVILVSTSLDLSLKVSKAIKAQLKALPRKNIAKEALKNSKVIIAKDLNEAVTISNDYAPEHLIIQTKDPRSILAHISNAGSVFLGSFSPESMGDYASGTNHVLPTYGFSKTYSSLNLSDFYKKMTVQELNKDGFKHLAPIVQTLADAEGLIAHKNAISIRLKNLK